MIMTSNHPELLDRALVRPGRIDVSVSRSLSLVEFFSALQAQALTRQRPFGLGEQRNIFQKYVASSVHVSVDNVSTSEAIQCPTVHLGGMNTPASAACLARVFFCPHVDATSSIRMVERLPVSGIRPSIV